MPHKGVGKASPKLIPYMFNCLQKQNHGTINVTSPPTWRSSDSFFSSWCHKVCRPLGAVSAAPPLDFYVITPPPKKSALKGSNFDMSTLGGGGGASQLTSTQAATLRLIFFFSFNFVSFHFILFYFTLFYCQVTSSSPAAPRWEVTTCCLLGSWSAADNMNSFTYPKSLPCINVHNSVYST